MLDKFDLFERYTDDSVEDHFCTFVCIDNLGKYSGFKSYMIGDSIIDEVRQGLVKRFDNSCVFKFSSTKFIIMHQLTKSKSQDFDYRDKKVEDIAKIIKNEIEDKLSINEKEKDERKKVRLVSGISRDCRLGQIDGLFTLVRMAYSAWKEAIITKKAYYATNESFLSNELEKEKLFDQIEEAYENDDFIPHFQPIIEMDTKKIIGAEAFVRWKMGNYRVLAPNKFLNIAEEKEILHKIDESVIEKTLQIYRVWAEDEIIEKDFKLHVNLSKSTLLNTDFKTIADLTKKYNINTSNICFELQSDTFEYQSLREKIKGVKSQGFKIAIDNFGLDNISLSSIVKTGDVDQLKIDRNVLPTGNIESIHNKIYKALVMFSIGLETELIVQGIETSKQFDFCLEHGINNVQGYYFSKELNESEFKVYLEKYKDSIL